LQQQFRDLQKLQEKRKDEYRKNKTNFSKENEKVIEDRKAIDLKPEDLVDNVMN
jgi:hypothetical protein